MCLLASGSGRSGPALSLSSSFCNITFTKKRGVNDRVISPRGDLGEKNVMVERTITHRANKREIDIQTGDPPASWNVSARGVQLHAERFHWETALRLKLNRK